MAYIGKSPTGTGIRQRYYFTATGGETSLSGTDDNGLTLSYADGAYVDVSLNGVALVAGTDYNTSTANTIAGLDALAANDIVEIITYDIFTVADAVSAKDGGTFSGNVTFSNNATVSGDLDVTGDMNIAVGDLPTGTVLQVVQTHLNTTSSQSLTAGTRTTVNDVNATITPKSTSNKVLAMVRWHGEASTDNHHNSVWGLRRGSTDVGEAGAAGSRRMGIAGLLMGYHTGDATSTQDAVQFQFLDSPATTSATTYYLTALFNNSCTLYRNRSVTDSDNSQFERLTCSMILMEIAG